MIRYLAAIVATSLATAGCASGPDLAGTTWQLVSIQSMNDALGTTKVPEPSHFTLEFGRDGRVTLRLDCNRGTGDYKIAPAGDGSSGSLTLGPIASTRAMCPPPYVDQRVVRDMAYVRSYLRKGGRLYLSLMADGGIYEWAPLQMATEAPDKDRSVKSVQFAKSKRSTVIHDRVVGRQYIDYQLRSGAGQRMTVSLKGSNGANYFNLLPPDSDGPAMASGELIDNRFDGLLPDDGVYTIRVFLYRAAARRNEASDFTLTVGVTGAPLMPVPAGTDAVLPGTRYHASDNHPMRAGLSKTRKCEALVVRRGFDGTATVELRWDGNLKRRILFIKGEPKAADVPQAHSGRGVYVVSPGSARAASGAPAK